MAAIFYGNGAWTTHANANINYSEVSAKERLRQRVQACVCVFLHETDSGCRPKRRHKHHTHQIIYTDMNAERIMLINWYSFCFSYCFSRLIWRYLCPTTVKRHPFYPAVNFVKQHDLQLYSLFKMLLRSKFMVFMSNKWQSGYWNDRPASVFLGLKTYRWISVWVDGHRLKSHIIRSKQHEKVLDGSFDSVSISTAGVQSAIRTKKMSHKNLNELDWSGFLALQNFTCSIRPDWLASGSTSRDTNT